MINCADTEPLTDRALAKQISEESIKLAPFADVGNGPSDALEQCSFWPVPPTSKAGARRRTRAADGPGGLLDRRPPPPPYEDGVSLAKQMKARLLSVENDSHTVVLQGSNRCADDIAEAYLVDLTLPAQDTKCGRS